jgi:lambda repressor-like predicted transcriptional regulator
LSNSSPTPLSRALRAYQRMTLTHPAPVRPARVAVKRAIQLSTTQLAHLVERYAAGATVYELATEFNVHRHTVATRLQQQGVQLRLASPTPADVDEMVRLYESGLSLMRVAHKTGLSAETVRRNVLDRGVRTRDTHGRGEST